MSIMDHDPKYTKLREWREQHGIVGSLPLPKPPEQTILLRFLLIDESPRMLKSIRTSLDQLAILAQGEGKQ